MEPVTCPLCPDAPPARPYHQEAGYSAVQCGGCGLVYVTPRPTEQEMKRLYEGQDTHIDIGAQIRKRHRKIAEARAALAVIARHAGAPRGRRLLEIGVGAGYFLAEACAAGWDAVGVDLNAVFVRFAREALGVSVVEGTLASAPFAKASFDVVFHRNVLSHLAYPVEDVARMAELLSPGGIMVFETGNVAELPGERFRGTDALALPDHLFHFSEATLRTLLARAGLSCVEVRRAAVLGQIGPLWAVRRALARPVANAPRAPSATRPPVSVPSSAPPRRLVPELAARLEHALLDRAGRALAARGERCSLVVVARRPHEARPRAAEDAHAR